MPVSAVQQAKRAFVTLMKTLAGRHGVDLHLTRDSPDANLRSAYRQLSLRVHPDRTGDGESQKRLNAAHDAWMEAVSASKGRGGRHAARGAAADAAASQAMAVVLPTKHGRPRQDQGLRIRSRGVLLTYQKFREASVWQRFLAFVHGVARSRAVWYWAATMETNADGTFHLHLMLQFKDATERSSQSFAFEGVCPNGQPNDLLGEGWGGRHYQQSLNRGFFYVWAAKEGTAVDAAGDLCVAGNYLPAWTRAKFTYPVKGRWLDALFQSHKLSMDTYETYIYLARDGVLQRKRNLDAIRERAHDQAVAQEVEERVARIQRNPDIYQRFQTVPEAVVWLKLFEVDALRYPMLVVHAPSFTGKTEWAKSLFSRPLELKIGTLPHFPETMRRFDRNRFDGLILDDVRDTLFLSQHQDKLQGKYSGAVEFASTAGGTCAYWRDLYRVPVVVTVNDSTENLELFKTGAHDFLGKRENVQYLRFTGRPGEAPPSTSADI